MGVVLARLVFLAFLGLTGTIIYNALYLQDQHGPAAISTAAPPARVIAGTTARTAPVEVKRLPPVSTDLPTPPPPEQAAEEPQQKEAPQAAPQQRVPAKR